MAEPSAAAASPRVTVIIPTYNWSSVLPYSIGSVLRQSFTDFELLVVGDGCTDNSEQVVTAISDSRLRWINLPVNSGHQTAPNNEGLRQARGSIIAYLGHDDLWLTHHLELMVAEIDAGAGVAHSIVHMVSAKGDILSPAGEMARYRPGKWMPPTGVAHLRDAAQKVGGWRDYRDLSTDPESDLWLRMHRAGFTFRCLPRLTAVKFPASCREGSYSERPSHEQQQWTERILREKDLEAVEMGKLLVAAELQLKTKLTFRAASRAVLVRTGYAIRRRLSFWRPRPAGKGEMVQRRRKFKGLEAPTDIA